MRRVRVAALVLGAILLVGGLGSGLAVARVVELRAHELSATVEQQATTTDDYFRRISSVVLLSAQSPAYQAAYEGLPAGHAPSRAGLAVLDRVRIDSGLAQIEMLLGGLVTRACYVDGSGVVLSCVLNGQLEKAAPAVDPSWKPLLAATSQIPDGMVLQGRPYLSATTHDDVAATSIAIRDRTGRMLGVVAVEAPLTGLAAMLATAAPGSDVHVVEAGGGTVVLDTIPGDPSPVAAGSTYPVRQWESLGSVVLGRRTVDYQRLTTSTATAVNANDWFVVLSSDPPPAGWRTADDVGPVLLTLAGMLLLALSAAGFVQHGRELSRRALRDDLTGLANRQGLHERLARSLAGRGDLGAVMIIDLDRFKTVNDTLGYIAGDLLLAAVAERFAELCLPGELLARLGGDEFGYLVPGPAPHAQLAEHARDFVRVLETPIMIDGLPVQVGCSIGIAVVGEHGDDVATLVRRADQAMYEAKRRRTGVTIFDPGLETRNTAGLGFETSMLLALERDELVLHYQPQIDIRSGEVSGVEALVRWQHPEHGLIYPDKFIPMAEETGLIVGLTKHVLAMALDQALAWSLAGTEIPIAVNLAARNVADTRLPSDVQQLLVERGLPARMLRLELTETDLLGDPDQARTVLEELRDLGVELAVDDFGTGFASLSQLRHLPFKELKIDKSFVAVLEGDPQAVHIVDSVVDLAHGLGLTVTAEGVETTGCLDMLRSVGCDVAQGYLFSRPMPPDACLRWVVAHDPLSVARVQPVTRIVTSTRG